MLRDPVYLCKPLKNIVQCLTDNKTYESKTHYLVNRKQKLYNESSSNIVVKCALSF
jgi:hypothetical protein